MEKITDGPLAGPKTEEPKRESKLKTMLVALLFALFLVIAGGLFWIYGPGAKSPVGAGWFLFSYTAGLTMIVLPCTFPLLLVIVPLVMGKGMRRGIGMALAFSIGVSVMLSMYGILAAVLGKTVFGFSDAGGETLKNIFYVLAGIFAIVFSLGQLGFLKVKIPTYSGAAPMFIQRQPELFKALLLGLFLGNIGVGCPHPATPIILGEIAVVGDIFYGWLLFFVHALGRVTPLIFFAMLALLGVNATVYLMRHRSAIEKATAWGMVFVGGFLFTLGFFGHAWWVNSGTHTLLEAVTQEERFLGILAERLNTAAPHAHGVETGTALLFGLPLWLGNWVLVAFWMLPIWWYFFRERKRVQGLIDGAERLNAGSVLAVKKWFFVTFTILLGVLFIYVFPHNFLEHKALEMEEDAGEMNGGIPAVRVVLTPERVTNIGENVALTFVLEDENGKPLEGLEINHERILHVLIVSEDFRHFAHIHHEDEAPLREEDIARSTFRMHHAFPFAARYRVVANFTHEGHEIVKQFWLEVGDVAARPVTIEKDLAREKTFEGYSVRLEGTAEPESGKEAHLTYIVTKNGQDVTNLEPYLAAPLHAGIWDVNLNLFTHAHGEVPSLSEHSFLFRDAFAHEEDIMDMEGMDMDMEGMDRHGEGEVPRAFGPRIELHHTFPYAGLWVIFGEFKHEGKVIATKFMVNVLPREGDMAAPNGH